MKSSPEDRIRLVVGLGNPGPEYDRTRHNIGFELLDALAKENDLNWSRERKFRAKIAINEKEVVFAKPLTFMNVSGNAVARLVRHYRLDPQQILVVYDDVDLPISRIRFRASGSAAGHNGIKSIIQFLGTETFPRLKIGIGAAEGREQMVDHVLGRFDPEEWNEMQKVLAIAGEGVNCSLSAGLLAAMNQYNRKTGLGEKGL
ncbi:MAG: aminoacyl-tRNA hydrolase [Verrucomicrobiota bacterium]